MKKKKIVCLCEAKKTNATQLEVHKENTEKQILTNNYYLSNFIQRIGKRKTNI